MVNYFQIGWGHNVSLTRKAIKSYGQVDKRSTVHHIHKFTPAHCNLIHVLLYLAHLPPETSLNLNNYQQIEVYLFILKHDNYFKAKL